MKLLSKTLLLTLLPFLSHADFSKTELLCHDYLDGVSKSLITKYVMGSYYYRYGQKKDPEACYEEFRFSVRNGKLLYLNYADFDYFKCESVEFSSENEYKCYDYKLLKEDCGNISPMAVSSLVPEASEAYCLKISDHVEGVASLGEQAFFKNDYFRIYIHNKRKFKYLDFNFFKGENLKNFSILKEFVEDVSLSSEINQDISVLNTFSKLKTLVLDGKVVEVPSYYIFVDTKNLLKLKATVAERRSIARLMFSGRRLSRSKQRELVESFSNLNWEISIDQFEFLLKNVSSLNITSMHEQEISSYAHRNPDKVISMVEKLAKVNFLDIETDFALVNLIFATMKLKAIPLLEKIDQLFPFYEESINERIKFIKYVKEGTAACPVFILFGEPAPGQVTACISDYYIERIAKNTFDYSLAEFMRITDAFFYHKFQRALNMTKSYNNDYFYNIVEAQISSDKMSYILKSMKNTLGNHRLNHSEKREISKILKKIKDSYPTLVKEIKEVVTLL